MHSQEKNSLLERRRGDCSSGDGQTAYWLEVEGDSSEEVQVREQEQEKPPVPI